MYQIGVKCSTVCSVMNWQWHLLSYHSVSACTELIQSSCIIHSSGSGAVIRSTYSISTTSSWNTDGHQLLHAHPCLGINLVFYIKSLCVISVKPQRSGLRTEAHHTVDMPSVSMWADSGVRRNWPLTRKSKSTLLWDAAEKNVSWM